MEYSIPAILFSVQKGAPVGSSQGGQTMKKLALVASFVGATALLAPGTADAQGSNLGSYGAQFVPGTIAGKVTAGGAPVAGARVETTAGQFATTDASGNYALHVDASGVYDVKVSTATKVAGPVQATVALGSTTVLDFTALRNQRRPRRNLPSATSPVLEASR
jgi:hypothetical protein